VTADFCPAAAVAVVAAVLDAGAAADAADRDDDGVGDDGSADTDVPT